jgi:hypothetical protein
MYRGDVHITWRYKVVVESNPRVFSAKAEKWNIRLVSDPLSNPAQVGLGDCHAISEIQLDVSSH